MSGRGSVAGAAEAYEDAYQLSKFRPSVSPLIIIGPKNFADESDPRHARCSCYDAASALLSRNASEPTDAALSAAAPGTLTTQS